jgi:16S rRNA (adenine1518-N6/adenine1519-N6)-dimethyltransferase
VRGTTPGDEELRKQVFAIVDSAFGQRRKTLRSSLATALGNSARIDDVLAKAGIDSGLRGEQLSLADFVAIAKAAKVQ